MKIFQVNFLNIVFFLAVLGVGLVVPSLIIESIWNSSTASSLAERDLSIELWQASLLWGSVLCVLYMTGIFKFKLDLKTIDSIDLDNIDDPHLRDEIEKLKAYQKRKEEESEKEDNKEA